MVKYLKWNMVSKVTEKKGSRPFKYPSMVATKLVGPKNLSALGWQNLIFQLHVVYFNGRSRIVNLNSTEVVPTAIPPTNHLARRWPSDQARGK